MNTVRTSVVIPTRDAALVLPSAVAAVLSQDEDGTLEVVIAVGPSADETSAVAGALAADPRVRVVDNPEGSTPAALNRAIAASTGEVVVRVDAQSVIPPGYIARVVELLESTGAGNVGGLQVPTAEAGFAACVAAAMRSRLGSGGAAYRSGGARGPVDTVYLGAFRREALEAVGGYDERLRRNQDYELNWRLRQAGYTVHLDPALAVAYTPRGSARALWRQYHDYGRYKRFMLRLHPASIRVRQLAAPAVVVSLLASGLVALVSGRARALLPVGAYVAAVSVSSATAAPQPALAPGTALATVIMHVAWGWGFLFGPHPDA